MCTYFDKAWKGLTTYKDPISSVAAIATTAGIIFAAYQIYQTSKSFEAAAVYQVQRDGRELFKSLRQDSLIFEYIYQIKKEASYDPSVVSAAELTIAELIQYFSSVFNQHRSGIISDDYWDTFAQEICAFFKHRPVSEYWRQKASKGKYGNEFKKFGNSCLK